MTVAAKNFIAIDCLKVSQEIGPFYIGRASASDLLRVCKFDFRRMNFTNGYLEYLGIQRKVSANRRRDIADYTKTVDACFPSAIVLSVPEKCVAYEDICDDLVTRLVISEYIDEVEPRLNIALNEVASIIDGQHRLAGIEDSGLDVMLPVSVFVGLEPAQDATIFSVVNLAQTKVNKSLVYDLFELSRNRSPEKTAHEIAVALDQISYSPFRERIKRLGVATDGRRGETLAQATIVRGLLPYLTDDALADRDIGRRFDFWDPPVGPEARRRIFRRLFTQRRDDDIIQIVLNYFIAVSERWPEAWSSTGVGNMINRTNGYNAFMRFLRPAYRYFTTSDEIVPREEFRQLFDRVQLGDGDFNIRRFVPGSGGAKLLYDILVNETGVPTN